MSETLDVLNRRWRNACMVVFGQDVGPLKDYLPWLDGLIEPNITRKSSISGKPVAYAIKEYDDKSKWISLDEIDFTRNGEPFSINEIKDFDSLLQAVSERARYAGNIVLGNSGHVEKSSSITDSFYMHNTAMLGDCKYCASCATGRLCENSFGTYGPGESEFCIRCTQTYRDKRCFELWVTQNCSDSYYSYNINGCSDCIFCFNVKSRRHCIGNLELEADKYAQIKKELLLEMSDELKRKRKLPSLMEIVGRCKFERPGLKTGHDTKNDDTGRTAAERGFRDATKLILGKRMEGITDYQGWLRRHTHPLEERVSAASGARILMARRLISIPEISADRILTMEEAMALGRSQAMQEKDAESLTLANVPKFIGKFAFFPVEFTEGTIRGMTDCTACIDSALCFGAAGIVYSKYCGYGFYYRNAEHGFGCNQLFDSSFCINCYYSLKLTRCFEMDSCRSCSDSYYCHNCENLQDCMFCFNAKNLRYAIGNAEMGREEYLKIKRMVLSEIAGKLEKEKDFALDIYNVGAR